MHHADGSDLPFVTQFTSHELLGRRPGILLFVEDLIHLLDDGKVDPELVPQRSATDSDTGGLENGAFCASFRCGEPL